MCSSKLERSRPSSTGTKAEVRTAAEEVLRCLHLSFGLDIALCQAFIAGYRATAALSTSDLDRAAVAYSYHRIFDLRLYETIYVAGDDRPRRFLKPGAFVPFVDMWRSVRSEIEFH